jgi:hypothetical protein
MKDAHQARGGSYNGGAYERLIYNIRHSGHALFGVMLLLVGGQALAVRPSLLVMRIEHRIGNYLRSGQ